jgi:hypothetical protein
VRARAAGTVSEPKGSEESVAVSRGGRLARRLGQLRQRVEQPQELRRVVLVAHSSGGRSSEGVRVRVRGESRRGGGVGDGVGAGGASKRWISAQPSALAALGCGLGASAATGAVIGAAAVTAGARAAAGARAGTAAIGAAALTASWYVGTPYMQSSYLRRAYACLASGAASHEGLASAASAPKARAATPLPTARMTASSCGNQR